MVDRLAMYGYRARFFDTRITFPVPVVTARRRTLRRRPGPAVLRRGRGGSTRRPRSTRALCEIATDAVNLPAARSGTSARLRAMAADFGQVTALHDHPLLYGVPEMGRHADFLLRPPRPAATVRRGRRCARPAPAGGRRR